MKSHPILSIAYQKLFTMKLNPLRICSVDCILPLWQSLYSSLFAFPAGDYSTFHGMKWLRVSLLPLGWDVSPSEGTPPPPSFYQASLKILLGGERHCERKVFCTRTQQWLSQVLNPDPSTGVQYTEHQATVSPTGFHAWLPKLFGGTNTFKGLCCWFCV